MVGGSLGTPSLIGDMLAVAMALLMATMMVLVRKYPAAPMVTAMCVSSLQIMIVAILIADPFQASTGDVWWLIVFGLIQATGIILLTEGIRLIPASQAALIGSLDIPLAPLWAWLILTEIPAFATFLGGTVALAAVGIYMRHNWKLSTGGNCEGNICGAAARVAKRRT